MATVHTLPVHGPYGRLRRADRVGVFGLSFSGKTYYVDKELLREARRRVFFTISPTDYAGEGRHETTVYELAADPSPLEARDVCVVCRATGTTRDALAAEACTLIRLMRKVCADENDTRIRGLGWGGCVVVLDDVGDYKEGGDFEEVAGELGRTGRHHNVLPVFVSQCAIDVPIGFRRQMTQVHSFVQVDDNDIKAIGSRCGKDFAEKVRKHKPGEPPAVWVLATFAARAPLKE